MKRSRHNLIVGADKSSFWAMAWFVSPPSDSNTICARFTRPAGKVVERVRLSSCSRSSGVTANGAFGRPIGMVVAPPECLKEPTIPAKLLLVISWTEH